MRACRFPTASASTPTAYRLQLAALGLEASARGAFATEDRAEARRHALRMKLELLEQPIVPAVLDPLLEAWRELVDANRRADRRAVVGARRRS